MPTGIYPRNPHSETTKQKIRLSHLGKKSSIQHRENLSKALKGRKLSLQHAKNIGKAVKLRWQNGEMTGLCMTGRKHSDTTKEKISISHIGDRNPRWKGGLSLRNKHCPDCDKYIFGASSHCIKCSHKYREHDYSSGKTHSEEWKNKMSILHKRLRSGDRLPIRYGKDHPAYKGEAVGYWGLHKWVQKELGIPSICEICNTKISKRYEWANISNNYLRDLDDWMRLCKPCHIAYDKLFLQYQCLSYE